MKNTFTIHAASFEEDINRIEDRLSQTKADKKDLTRTRLILEEGFFRLKDHLSDDDIEIAVNIRQRFENVTLQMIICGAEYNPLIPPVSDENEEDTYRYTILNAYSRYIGFQRKNERSIMTVSVHEAGSHTIRNTFVCMVAGIIVGLMLKNFVTADHIKSFQDGLIIPLRTIFLTLLQMMVAPVVFFSILSGMISMSDKNNLGKRGIKLIGISLSMILCITVLLLSTAFLIFRSENPAISALLSSDLLEKPVSNFSFMDMLVAIIPVDIIDPFTGSDILQTLFLAVFFGIIINHWPQGARIVDTVQFMNKFFMRVLSVIVKLVPAFVFISMINMTINTGAESFLALGELVAGNALGYVIVLIFASIVVMLFVHVSPLKYIKKVSGYSVIPFSLSSSNAAIPFTLDFCNEEMGIDSKLSMFSIPIGIQFNKAGACCFLCMASVMTIRAYGMSVTFDLIAKLFFAIFVMSMAKPSVPAAGIVCLSSVFQAIGVPPEAVEIVLCITPILNMFNTATGATANLTSTTLLANWENCFNRSAFNSKAREH